ncbi:MAG: hypothetical protein LUC85_01785 [Bacteroidales bacterium]|nr:hypothetical protein [Bacteroidales bacterium]MCD8393548.1 hypothetical protein [Bacteroidales bacterium]
MKKEISLNTPIEEMVMPDKLRRRLQMLRCFTFGEAMRQDYRQWDDVNVKVVNAMKRFKQEYANVYTSLLGSSAEAPQQCVTWEERRFYVANNILNACIASGQLEIPTDDPTELLEMAMNDVIRAADVFLDAFAKSSKIAGMEEVHVEDIPDDDDDDDSDTEPINEPAEEPAEEPVEEPAEEPAEGEVPPTLALKKGDWIEITRRTAKDHRGHQSYKVGDRMRVVKVIPEGEGQSLLHCSLRGKTVKVRSSRFEWKVLEKPQK